jgi:hypothetical protein
VDASAIIGNLQSPPILFFLLGALACVLRSDLEIPAPLPKLFSLFLLLAIGFRGGAELGHAGVSLYVVKTLLAAIGMALVVPLYAFFLLRRRLGVADAAAIGATYGSISAVTFLTADAFLRRAGLPPAEQAGGHMVATMALMESPAIVVGVLLARRFGETREKVRWGALLRESFLNGSVFLLVGALLIGVASSDKGREAMRPFTSDIFTGMLSFFLLDMGIVAARRLRDLRSIGRVAVAFALLVPLGNALLAMSIAWALGLTRGDALLFTVLGASASYIAVPAAMRHALPEANPSVYVGMALGLTFPLNIVVGIPLYHLLIGALWR